jgi:hypothetical protein
VKQAKEQGINRGIVQRDRDSKYAKWFDRALRMRVEVKVTEFRAPNTNAFIERFVQSIQQECLDRFVVFGSGHMDQICSEYMAHYHKERPHQGEGIDNELLVKRRKTKPIEAIPFSEVRCSERLGGLLKSYGNKAHSDSPSDGRPIRLAENYSAMICSCRSSNHAVPEAMLPWCPRRGPIRTSESVKSELNEAPSIVPRKRFGSFPSSPNREARPAIAILLNFNTARLDVTAQSIDFVRQNMNSLQTGDVVR